MTRWDLRFDWIRSGAGNQTIDDSVRRVITAAQAPAKRAESLAWLWGTDGPTTDTPTVVSDVESPFVVAENLLRVDRLEYDTYGQRPEDETPQLIPLCAYHFVPETRVNKLLLWCEGHGESVGGEAGQDALIAGAIATGWDVVLVFMPTYNPRGAGSLNHYEMLQVPYSATAGSPLRYFLLMGWTTMNLLSPTFAECRVGGLSGGGWTSLMLKALDVRFSRGYSVAGFQPLYASSGMTVPDYEGRVPYFANMTTYLDLCILAARNSNLQVIYLENDDCCFGPDQYDANDAGARIVGMTWEESVEDWRAEVEGVVGANRISVQVDTEATYHSISTWAKNVIIGDLA